MSHQDTKSDIIINHEAIKQVVDTLIKPEVFANIKKARAGATWTPRLLAVTALLWAISGGGSLGDRFKQARKISAKVFRWLPAPGISYQGFIKMLRKWHCYLQLAIIPHVRMQMKEMLPGQWEVAGLVVFAADGSRIELSRTESLEDAFSPARKKNQKKNQKKGKGKGHRGRAKNRAKKEPVKKQSDESVAKKETSPQMWLTFVWHVGTGLPWAWRTGPSDSSERGHLEEMLGELPENSLITADAGFVGYDFWRAILKEEHKFVIRVGANVRLIKQLGYARQYGHTVYLWPEWAAKKKQPPLVLRLIVIKDGKHPMYLVTNLTKSQLSDRQAGTIYGARWGIELYFRTFKQTFGCRKLRSRTAKNADLELDWSMLGLWCICLVGQRELVESGQHPSWLSAARAIKAFQGTLDEYRVRPESAKASLWAKLRVAILDDYKRSSSKTSRNYPRKKKRQAIGAPKITKATSKQVNAAKELKYQQLEIWLTA
jgi:hypothetical protein